MLNFGNVLTVLILGKFCPGFHVRLVDSMMEFDRKK